MRRIFTGFLLFFAAAAAYGQAEITLQKRKGTRTEKISLDRIMRIQTSDREIQGTVTSRTDSTLTIQTFYLKDTLRIDTAITVKFDSIQGLFRCKAKNIATCRKRENSKTADRLIKFSTAAIIGTALAAPYVFGEEDSKITYTWGGTLAAIGYYILMNRAVNPQFYDLQRKWKFVKEKARQANGQTGN